MERSRSKLGPLNMMALDHNYCFLFTHQQPSFDWDPHLFGGAGDLQELMPLGIDSLASSEASTGYLQDAVAGWSDRCKRRRTASSSRDVSSMGRMAAAAGLQDFFQGFWDSRCNADPMESFSCMIQDHGFISDDPWSSFPPLNWSSIKQDEAAEPQLLQEELISSPSHDSQGRDTHESRPSPPSSTLGTLPPKGNYYTQRKKKGSGVVYPFAVVKPGGLDGDVTLADINERMLMRPTRPMRHPVGEFACGPWLTVDGPRLSGKAVIGLTRIHTQGRGTITIIRTRG